MHRPTHEIELSRTQVAKFLSVGIGTLAVWKSIKRYNLPCYARNGWIFYKLSDINKFLGLDIDNKDIEPLLKPKGAAKYLSQMRPVSTQTLLHWEHKHLFNFKAIRVGKRFVRYRRHQLDNFYKDQLKPH